MKKKLEIIYEDKEIIAINKPAKKLTIAQKLAKRKYRPAPRLIASIYKFLMVDIIGRKYKPKFHIIDDVSKCDGPCFVIFNHLSRIDHMYVMGASYPRITNMVAGCSEFYRKKFSFIFIDVDFIAVAPAIPPVLVNVKLR